MTGTWKKALHILCALMSLMSVLLVAQPVVATAADTADAGTITVIVRESASNSGFPIGQMVDGTKLTVLEEKKNFYKIDCYDMTGFVPKSQVAVVDGEYYVNCQETPGETDAVTYLNYEDVLSQRNDIYTQAKKQLGSRYRYGSARPGAFDCSGFTSYVMKQCGISIHRTASTQLQDGVIIPTEALQLGDLVFFKERSGKFAATHVGIYIGDNQMIHSARHGVVVESMDNVYYARYYLCARRVLNTIPLELEPAMPARTAAPILHFNSITGRTASCCDED